MKDSAHKQSTLIHLDHDSISCKCTLGSVCIFDLQHPNHHPGIVAEVSSYKMNINILDQNRIWQNFLPLGPPLSKHLLTFFSIVSILLCRRKTYRFKRGHTCREVLVRKRRRELCVYERLRDRERERVNKFFSFKEVYNLRNSTSFSLFAAKSPPPLLDFFAGSPITVTSCPFG